MNRLTASTTLIALFAGGTAAAPAFAQVLMPETTRWTMPDFDQRRQGLANSGNNHCVPTSHSNMLAYISDHGFPLVFPNVSNSFLISEYGDITTNIYNLGMDMGTTGSGGTTGQGCMDGMATFLGPWSLLFNINYQWGPQITPSDIYFSTLGGGMCSVCYGRWEYISANSRYERTGGGHCVTVRGMKDYYFPLQAANVNPLLKYRDPAADEGNVPNRLTMQSTYATSELRIRPFTTNFKGYGTSTMWELLSNSGDQYRRCLDGFTSITPIFVLVPDTSISTVSIKTVIHLPDSQEQGSFNLANLTDAAFGIGNHHVFAVGNYNADLTRLVLGNPFTGGYSHSILIPGNNARVAPGRNSEVYVVLGNLLRRYRPADDGTMPETGTPATLPSAFTNICYDDLRDGPTVLMGDGSVREYDKNLALVMSKTLATPPGWPGTAGPSFQRIIPGNTLGDYWFGPLTGNQIKRYTPAAGAPTRLVVAETITPPTGATLTDFSLTDQGELLLKRGGLLQVLKKNVAGGWDVDTDHPFNGLPVPGPGTLRMSRSRNNFDPALHNLPEWSTDVTDPQPLVAEVPDCLADLGRTGGVAEPDGRLDNNDFIVYIDQFFALDPRADIGVVGGVPGSDGLFDNNDFIVFIDRFFQGCP